MVCLVRRTWYLYLAPQIATNASVSLCVGFCVFALADYRTYGKADTKDI